MSHLYGNIMTDLSMVEESDRYYNWYHGYTQIKIPNKSNKFGCVNYTVNTGASSGSIATQYFGEEFDANKVETGPLCYNVYVYPPSNHPSVTLHLDIEKVSIKDSGHDRLYVTGRGFVGYGVEIAYKSFNYSPLAENFYNIQLSRDYSQTDVAKQELDLMPGFRVTWHYSGLEVEPWTKYYNDNKAFVRNNSNFKFLNF